MMNMKTSLLILEKTLSLGIFSPEKEAALCVGDDPVMVNVFTPEQC